ncbi:MAG: NAD(+)/NADH kinase [Caulobacteraceae bacterium]|nr:NAD(+)/NADH kinase [Caulobacteraceae bacterium]
MQHIEVVANPASGSVGPDVEAESQAIFGRLGLSAAICAPPGDSLTRCLREAIARKPDLLVVIAGDGTARAAAELCAQGGPMLAPLPGGTMNMLPYAIYGRRPWQDALADILQAGEERPLGGGQASGRIFLVAAILGAPALWAPAREAAREGKLGLALDRARRAWSRAFSSRLRVQLDSGPRRKAEAATFLCPLISKALDPAAPRMEAAVFQTTGAAEAFRLGLHALAGDWRNDPAVEAVALDRAVCEAGRPIPTILDGETVELGSRVEVTFRADMLRVLAPAGFS